MNAKEVLEELKSYGEEGIKKTLINHGAREPLFGVRVQDMKKIVKKVKKDHPLSLELYATGNADAMYLAGLIADEKKIRMDELQKWVEGAYYYLISEYTVAWLASESPYGFELGLLWIDSDEEHIAAAGWSTLSNLVSITADEDLDIDQFSKLLDRVKRDIHSAPNRVRYAMNGFVIATGSYLVSLTAKAEAVAKSIGIVHVDMGGTACKVPLAASYIDKMRKKGYLGRKRKQARC